MIVTLSSQPDVDNVHVESGDVTLTMDSDLKGSGHIHVTEDALFWWSQERQTGYMIEYPMIVLHGLVGAGEGAPPQVYCQLDATGTGDSLIEARFGSERAELVEAIYTAMCECQLLHPDEDDEDDEDEEMMMPALGGDALTIEGQQHLERLNIIEQPNGFHGDDEPEDGQFDDAE